MYFGTPVWPLKWDFPYDGTIKRIKELGFKGVELIAWNKDYFKDYYTKETIASLKKLVGDLGMVITNFNHTVNNIANEDKAKQEAALEGFKYAVETAAGLGAKNMTSVASYPFAWGDSEIMHIRHIPEVQIWTVNANLTKDWKGNYEQYVTNVRKCCEMAKQAGLRLCIEPHPYRYVNSASSMLRLIEHVGMDNLFMNFDPSHLFPSGDMPQVTVYEVAEKIGHTHFSDNDTLTNVHWRPGKGKIDWYAVMKALKEVGYDDVISFELEDVPGAVTPDAATSTGVTDVMEVELKLSMAYINDICKSLKINLDT